MIRVGHAPGKDPHRVELQARQAADETVATRFYALERIAADGFPRVGGSTVDGLVRDGLVKRLSGRVPFELTPAGAAALLAHREANR